MAQKTLDKYFTVVDSRLQCCSDEGSSTKNTSQIGTSDVVVVPSDRESDEEFDEEEVDEQMVLQEQVTIARGFVSVNSRRLNNFGSF